MFMMLMMYDIIMILNHKTDFTKFLAYSAHLIINVDCHRHHKNVRQPVRQFILDGMFTLQLQF